MDDGAVVTALLLFWGGVGIGLLLGGLAGWLAGFSWGIAIGCLVIGAGGLAGAGHLGWHRWHSLAGTQQAAGVLVEYVNQEDTDSNGRRTTTFAPRVRFRDSGGTVRETLGLGGDRRFEPGDAVTVRYRPERPDQALIADFQNLWGGVWGLGLFGVMPALFGSFFLVNAIAERREASRAPQPANRRDRAIHRHPVPDPRMPRRTAPAGVVQGLTVAGNIAFVGAFVVMIAMGDPMERAIAAGFGLIAAACAIHTVAAVLRKAGWDTVFVLVIVGTGFGLFGWGIWMLAG